jgi:signal transduction histidine kinase
VRPDDAATRDTHGAWLVLGAIALGIITAAVLASMLLGRRLAAPLERLVVSARRLGEGDFSARAPAAGIDEIDAVGHALDATAQRLDGLVTRERAFSADASHQLRTPLQALRIELEAIELRGDSPPELPKALVQVDRLQTTIETLLAVARDVPRRDTITDAHSVLDGVHARWHGALAADGRPLHLIVDAAKPQMRASSQVAGEILDVLVDNAHKHGAGAVTVAVRKVDAYISIEVSDEGRGLAIPVQEAFARGASARDGHGIGLPLARSLAHAEGGRLIITRSGPAPVISLLLPATTTGDTKQ